MYVVIMMSIIERATAGARRDVVAAVCTETCGIARRRCKNCRTLNKLAASSCGPGYDPPTSINEHIFYYRENEKDTKKGNCKTKKDIR